MKIEQAEKLHPEQFRKELMKKKLLKLVENKNNKINQKMILWKDE